MTKNKLLIKAYQALELLVEQMNVAAKAQEWDEVLDIEMRYMEQFNVIKELELTVHKQATLTASEQQRKAVIIQNILTQEQAVKDLVTPYMSALTKQIKGAQTQTKLNNSYVS